MTTSVKIRGLIEKSMKSEIDLAKTVKIKPRLCGKECPDWRAHNRQAMAAAIEHNERYISTSERRLAHYQSTGEIDSQVL